MSADTKVGSIDIRHNLFIELKNGKVKNVGENGVPYPLHTDPNKWLDAKGGLVTPGFVDAHTHPVFKDFRQKEFTRRIKGETYQQIAASGGGIMSSVRGVRTTSEQQLSKIVYKRFSRFLACGTTTIEAKSGYGLTYEDELKSLRVLKSVSSAHPLEVSRTLLAAHVIPTEYKETPQKYVDIICTEIIPSVAEEGLAEAIDVFLEEGAFDAEQTRMILDFGTKYGLKPRLHADQFTNGEGVSIAVDYGAISVDHMDTTNEDGIERLKNAKIPIVLLPGAVFFLRSEKFANARQMINSGCITAISTDFNPGTCPSPSMPVMMSLACLKMSMTPEEALWSATMGGAYAVKKEDAIGSLKSGYQADLIVWDMEDIDSIPYHFGNQVPVYVLKKGTLIAQNGNAVL